MLLSVKGLLKAPIYGCPEGSTSGITPAGDMKGISRKWKLDFAPGVWQVKAWLQFCDISVRWGNCHSFVFHHTWRSFIPHLFLFRLILTHPPCTFFNWITGSTVHIISMFVLYQFSVSAGVLVPGCSTFCDTRTSHTLSASD